MMAQQLADAGYRSVLVDLRGHGGSTGDWISFGVVESRDLSQVADELLARGLVQLPMGAYGVSVGGGTVIQWAAHDVRLGAVVAVSSFASLHHLGVRIFREFIPGYGWVASEASIRRGLDEAATNAGFDASEASPEEAVGRAKGPLLLIHGTKDSRVPPQNADRIYARARDGTRLVWVEGMGHNSTSDPGGVISQESLAWFTRWLGGP